MSIKSKIESLLFISAKPMSIKQLSELIKKTSSEVRGAGDELVENYKKSKAGVQIIKNGQKYQMVSSPENSKIVQEFIQDETTGELTRPSLEALTVIAYRGPITKIELERIRGVNCSLILRNILIRGLVEAKINKNDSETYYSVTFDFLRFLGVNNVKELPDYDKLHSDDVIDKILGEKQAEASIVEKKISNNIDKEEISEEKENYSDKSSENKLKENNELVNTEEKKLRSNSVKYEDNESREDPTVVNPEEMKVDEMDTDTEKQENTEDKKITKENKND